MFSTIPVLLGMFLNPLWPAYGEALARNDFFWVKKAFTRSLLLSFFLSAIPAAGLVLYGPMILNYWVGPAIQPTFELLLGLGLWTIVFTMGSAVGMLLNGANVIRFQVIFASFMAIVALISKVVLASVIGVAGIIWGTLLAYLVCAGIPQVIYVSRLLANMGKPGIEEEPSK
jgi:O-antigen/teichoic acid export membrane protein